MATIVLTQGMVAIVDDDMFELLNAHKWHAWRSKSGSFYAIRNLPRSNGTRSAVKMHRQITDAPSFMFVDYINHNTLDNRRSNLRLCCTTENQWNQVKKTSVVTTSRYKGVHWSKCANKWVSAIAIGKRRVHLGVFSSELSAALAYDAEAERLRGDFAATNRKLGLIDSSDKATP